MPTAICVNLRRKPQRNAMGNQLAAGSRPSPSVANAQGIPDATSPLHIDHWVAHHANDRSLIGGCQATAPLVFTHDPCLRRIQHHLLHRKRATAFCFGQPSLPPPAPAASTYLVAMRPSHHHRRLQRLLGKGAPNGIGVILGLGQGIRRRVGQTAKSPPLSRPVAALSRLKKSLFQNGRPPASAAMIGHARCPSKRFTHPDPQYAPDKAPHRPSFPRRPKPPPTAP